MESFDRTFAGCVFLPLYFFGSFSEGGGRMRWEVPVMSTYRFSFGGRWTMLYSE